MARRLIVEGNFLPEISSNAPVVANLTSAPPISGYLATTPRPSATQHLRIGDEKDPLLATWRVGLGQVSSWTSDSGERWSSVERVGRFQPVLLRRDSRHPSRPRRIGPDALRRRLGHHRGRLRRAGARWRHRDRSGGRPRREGASRHDGAQRRPHVHRHRRDWRHPASTALVSRPLPTAQPTGRATPPSPPPPSWATHASICPKAPTPRR